MVVLKVSDAAIPGGGTSADAAARLLRVLADGLIVGVITYVAHGPVALAT